MVVDDRQHGRRTLEAGRTAPPSGSRSSLRRRNGFGSPVGVATIAGRRGPQATHAAAAAPRAGAQDPQDPRKPVDRRLLLLVVAALIAAAIGAGAFLLLRDASGRTPDVATAMDEAGCTYREVDAGAPGIHIANPEASPKEWTTDPPTNGPHYGSTAIFGIYDQPIQMARGVHDLEHGGVAIYYGRDVSDEQVDAIARFYREDPVGLLVAPLPRLGNRVALTAWTAPIEGEEGEPKGHLAFCTRFDESAFATFRDELRFRGRALPARGFAAGELRLSWPAPGWRNWSYAPDLKSGVPEGT